MKKFVMLLVACSILSMVLSVKAAEVKIKGDFNNRFMVYTNHNDWLDQEKGVLNDGNSNETWGEAKYRLWFDAGSNGGKVKGVCAFEIGSLEYGKTGSVGKSVGGSYSGDAINVETRWLYTDFQVPWCSSMCRLRMGLQPFTVNSFYWRETIMGVRAYGAVNGVDWEAAWLRPVRDENKDPDKKVKDMDAFYGRINFSPVDNLKMGVFAVFHRGDPNNKNPAAFATITSQNYELKKLGNKFDTRIFTTGTDGSWTRNNVFAKWDLIYETGNIDNADFGLSYNGIGYIDNTGRSGVNNEDFELSAYLLHVDVGFKMAAWKFTYTFWYASGDDDPNDDNFDAFMAVDIDRKDSICIFKASFTDDDTFTEKDYILDKGFIMNKLAADYKAGKKLTIGAGIMYMMTAEDIEYGPYSDDKIGLEVDGYLKYKLYDNLEFAINAGYLFADDALDFYERNSAGDAVTDEPDGKSDEDIFVSTARVRYKF